LKFTLGDTEIYISDILKFTSGDTEVYTERPKVYKGWYWRLYREILKLTPGDTEVYNGWYYWLYFWIFFCMATYKTDIHTLLKK